MKSVEAEVSQDDPAPQAEQRGSVMPQVAAPVDSARATLARASTLLGRSASINPVAGSVSGFRADPEEPTAGKGPEEAKPEKTKINPFTAYGFSDNIDLWLLFLGYFAFGGIGAALPLNILFLSDGVSGGGTGDMGALNDAVINITCLGAGAFVAGFLGNWALELSAERQVRRAKQDYFEAILRQEVGFFDTKDIGTLAADVEMSCIKIRQGIGMKSGMIMKAIATIIGGYAVAFTKDWKLTLIVSASAPLITASFGVAIIFITRATERSKKHFTEASAIAEEALPAIRTVQAFGLEGPFLDRYIEKANNSQRAEMMGVRGQAISMGVAFLVTFLSYSLAWWYGGWVVRDKIKVDVLEGQLYAGTVMSTFFCVLMAAFSLGIIGPNLTALSTAAEAIVSIRTLANRESQIDYSLETGTEPAEKLRGKVEFRHVRFAYPSRPERDIYQDVNFVVEPGEQVALVGPSGAGKSTVVQLLMRFYDPQGGEILVDDTDTKEYNLKWFRNNLAYVQQEPRLFNASIYDNIICGRPEATREEVEAAAKAANAHDFIMGFVEGYKTNVGAGGSLLSGGQKQRVAIARAILRNPSILILDEATSALDNQSEKVVQQALDKLLQETRRTTFIIAHRLTTIRNASKIIVVDNVSGKGSMVIEMGTHEELMKIENGVYKQLVETQSKARPDAPGPSEAEDIASQQFAQLQGAGLRKEFSKQGSIVSRRSSSVVRDESAAVDAKKGKAKKSSAVTDMWKQQLRHWRSFMPAVMFSTLNGALMPANSLMIVEFLTSFFSWRMDQSVNQNAERIFDKAVSLAYIYIGLAFLAGFIVFMESLIGGMSNKRLLREIRVNLFGHLLHQDMEFFDNPVHNTGFLSSVMSADCEAAQVITGHNFLVLWNNISGLVFAIIIGLVSSWKLSLVVSCLYIAIVPIFWSQASLIQGTAIEMGSQDDVDSPAFVMNELVMNLKTVSAYNMQDQIGANYKKTLQKYYNKGKKNAMIVGSVCAFTEGSLFFAMAIAYRYGTYLVENDGLDYTRLLRANFAITFSGGNAAQSAVWTSDAKRAKTACENIFTVLRRKPKLDARDLSGSTPEVKGNVEFKDIKFRYPGRPGMPVLDRVTFDIKPGDTVALVGESGSGKSTITQLLLRFYDVGASPAFEIALEEYNKKQEELAAAAGVQAHKLPPAHDMFRGGVDVETYDIQSMQLKHLRASLGLVGQEPVLFDQTVSENIRNGKLGATEEEVIMAAKQANAHDFIMQLPEGYQTRVGKGGGLLSGGQKQRVAIARALIREPALLILDEATSALDPESEKVVQQALDKLLETSQRTTIIIAHRLSTIRSANKIVVFKPEAGKGSVIAEQGTHEELMKIENGIYRNLVNISEQAGSA